MSYTYAASLLEYEQERSPNLICRLGVSADWFVLSVAWGQGSDIVDVGRVLYGYDHY